MPANLEVLCITLPPFLEPSKIQIEPIFRYQADGFMIAPAPDVFAEAANAGMLPPASSAVKAAFEA